jgi:hypothetical protein
MRSRARVVAAILVALSVAATAFAEEVTLSGRIACAKCTLNKPDAKACQNVLLVPGPDGKKLEYYMARSEAGDAVGEVCTETTEVTVTGTVSEKDGRKWITASKVETRS